MYNNVYIPKIKSKEENTKGKTRPESIPLNPDGIPPALKAINRWVCWSWIGSAGLWTKIPINPRTKLAASSTNPATWTDYDTALQTYSASLVNDSGDAHLSGIGIVLDGSDGLAGVDVDMCRADGELNPDATDIVNKLNTYTEVSPSGLGVRLFAYATGFEGKRKKRGNYELYTTGRYLTVTGQRLSDTPAEVHERTAEVNQFHARYLTDPAQPIAERAVPCARIPRQSPMSDEEYAYRLRRCLEDNEKARRLFKGDYGGYPSPSEAVSALVWILTWYLDDFAAVDRAFRQSALYHGNWRDEKWDRLGLDQFERASEGQADRFTLSKDWDLPLLEERIKNLSTTPPVQVVSIGDDLTEGSVTSKTAPALPTPTDTRKIRGLRLDQLLSLPKPSWQIREYLPADSLTVLFGESGSYKTFLALDWALCVASGIDWLGYPTKPGPVIYLSGEGNSGITKRIEAWMTYRQRPYPEDLVIVPSAFDFKADLRAMEAVVSEDLQKRPALTVMDTLNRYFGMGDENSTKDMTVFIAGVSEYRRIVGGGMLIVHHTGWSNQERERGNYSLRGASDATLGVTKTNFGLTLNVLKQKDSPPAADTPLKTCQVNVGIDADGQEITSLALSTMDEFGAKFNFLSPNEKDYLLFLWTKFNANNFTQADAREVYKDGPAKSTVQNYFANLTKRGILIRTEDIYRIVDRMSPVLIRQCSYNLSKLGI